MAKLVRCARCRGKGTVKKGGGVFGPGKEIPCPACGGSGKVEQK